MAYRFWDGEFPRYVSAGEIRARAMLAAARLGKRSKGRKLAPVTLTGRKIATTFWGKAWCDNLESYADFAYRLDRGRSYVRRGAVIDLGIEAGRVRSHVSGTYVYDVEVRIQPLQASRWKALVKGCGDRVESVVSLLEGRLPDEVLRLVTHRERGLFPAPREIRMTCTCPDGAVMCKHVAATLYGVGARLDERPELLFLLRGADHNELVHAAAGRLGAGRRTASGSRVVEGEELGALFGIELAPSAERAARRTSRVERKPKPSTVSVAASVSARRPPGRAGDQGTMEAPLGRRVSASARARRRRASDDRSR